METIRLRAVQQPSRVERLLVSFASSCKVVGAGAYLLRDPGAAPLALQVRIAEAQQRGHAWCCWTDGAHIWLFTGEMSLALSRECGSPVLEVRIYREDGSPEDSDCWLVDQDGNWRRCAVVTAQASL